MQKKGVESNLLIVMGAKIAPAAVYVFRVRGLLRTYLLQVNKSLLAKSKLYVSVLE